MAVFIMAVPPRGKSQMACNYRFPTRTTFQINSEFWKKGTFRWENRTSCLVGLQTRPTIVPRSGSRTDDLPPPPPSSWPRCPSVCQCVGRRMRRSRPPTVSGSSPTLNPVPTVARLYRRTRAVTTWSVLRYALYTPIEGCNHMKCSKVCTLYSNWGL